MPNSFPLRTDPPAAPGAEVRNGNKLPAGAGQHVPSGGAACNGAACAARDACTQVISKAKEYDKGVTEEFEATAQLRIAVNRLSRRIRAEKAGDELSDAQFSVLATLVREGSRTIGQLAEAERVTPPSMNRTVNALAEGGYVVREGSPDDGRKVFVKATASGVEFVTETRLRRDRWLDQRTRELTSAQRETLREASVIMRQLADS